MMIRVSLVMARTEEMESIANVTSVKPIAITIAAMRVTHKR